MTRILCDSCGEDMQKFAKGIYRARLRKSKDKKS